MYNFEQSKQHVLKESNEFLSRRKYTSARANNNDQSSVSHGNNGRYQVVTFQDSQSSLSTNLTNHIDKKIHYDKGNIVEGILPRLDKCPSINLTHEELIVEPSSSSQSGDFNQLLQGNSEDKQKSQIWFSQSNHFNSSNPWSVPSNKVLQTKKERNKRKEAITNWPQNNTLTNPKRVSLILSHKVTRK